MAKIIMFSGGIGSGKAHCMNQKIMELKETGNSICMISFADPIKKLVAKCFGIDKNGKRLHYPSPICFESFVSIVAKFLNADNRYISNDSTTINFCDAITQATQDDDQERRNGARLLMQITGTEIGQQIKKEAWPMLAVEKIKKMESVTPMDYYIIDDLRFVFEYFCFLREFQHQHEVAPYYVHASEETRAKRRGLTVDELRNQSKHLSERESSEVLLPFMRLYFPDNIILNN
jgi:hypothetical protein